MAGLSLKPFSNKILITLVKSATTTNSKHGQALTNNKQRQPYLGITNMARRISTLAPADQKT